MHQLIVQPAQQQNLCILLAQTGNGFQLFVFTGFQLFQLTQTGIHQLGAVFQVFFFLFQSLGFFVQRIFLLNQAVLLAAHFAAALFDLFFGIGLQLKGFVLCFNNSFLAFLLGSFDRIVYQTHSLLFGAANFGFRGVFAVGIAAKKAPCGENDADHHCNDNGSSHLFNSSKNYIISFEAHLQRAG